MASVLRKRIKAALLRPETFYRLYLRSQHGAGSTPQALEPLASNGILKNRAEWEAASSASERAGLPHHRERSKDWDHLGAVSAILRTTDKNANVLDAGAELYSNVLPSLYLYGYRNLWGVNLGFPFALRRGPIRYEPGDITRLNFADGFFDAACCLSVIEHGVPLEEYFREMRRVLKPGALLVTSTDYFPTPINTAGKLAHGAPIKIFNKDELRSMLNAARAAGFEQTEDFDLDCSEKPIRWEQYGLEYTFVMFTLRRL
jgi:SAM-dependent methyltransferase